MLRFHVRSLRDVAELAGIFVGAVLLWIVGDQDPNDVEPIISGGEDGFTVAKHRKRW